MKLLIKTKRTLFMLLTIIIALVFVSASAFAEINQADEAQSKQPAPISLTLADALKVGFENNAQISLAALSVETAKISVDQAQTAGKRMEKMVKDGEDAGGMYRIPLTADIYQVMNVFPAQAGLGYELTILSRDYTTQSVKYGIETAYYGLQKAEKALQVAKVALRRSETQLNNSKAREKQGLSPKLDVVSAESNYLMAQAGYEQGRNYVLSARMRLNQMLGLDINTPIIVKTQLKFDSGEDIDINTAISQAKQVDLSYGVAKNAYENAKLMKDFEQGYNAENTYVYQKAEISYKEAEQKMLDAEISLEIKVREAYGNLQTAALNYKSLENSVKLAGEALRLANLRYQEGLATVYDVQEADAAYQQAEMGLLDAIHSHNLAKAAFQYQVYGIGGY